MTNDVDHVGWDTKWVDLRSELANFRVALDWAVADLASIDYGLRLLTRLWGSVDRRRSSPRSVGANRYLPRSGVGSAAARSGAAYAAGLIADDLGTRDRSIQLLGQALEEAHVGGDREGESVRGASCARWPSRRTTSLRLAITPKPAIELSVEAGNHVLHASCLTAFANLLSLAGRLDAAAELLQEALDGPVGSIATVETSVQLVAAVVQLEQGDYAAARRANSEALALSEQHGMSQFIITAHLRLAGVRSHRSVGDADGAAAHLDSAKAFIPDISRVGPLVIQRTSRYRSGPW